MSSLSLADQEQERRRKAERAAHAAMNGPKALAYEYAGPDYEVRLAELPTLSSPYCAQKCVCTQVVLMMG